MKGCNVKLYISRVWSYGWYRWHIKELNTNPLTKWFKKYNKVHDVAEYEEAVEFCNNCNAEYEEIREV